MTINQLSQFSSIFMKVGGYSSTFFGYPDPVYFKGSEKGSEHPDPNVQTRNSSNEKNQKVNLYNLMFVLILFIFWGIFACPVFLGVGSGSGHSQTGSTSMISGLRIRIQSDPGYVRGSSTSTGYATLP